VSERRLTAGVPDDRDEQLTLDELEQDFGAWMLSLPTGDDDQDDDEERAA
jgi:hypothetical protein